MDYVRHFWISERGPTIERELAKQFRDKMAGQAEVASFVRNLDDHAGVYHALFFVPLEHGRLEQLSHDGRCYVAATTRILRIEQIRPLMIAVWRRFDKEEAEKAYRMMLSWSMRYLVVGSGGGGFLDKHYGAAAADVSRGALKTAKDLRSRFADIVPNDRQFESAFRAHSISNERIARYVLRSLEGCKRQEDNRQIRHFDNPDVASLEHIIPQKRSDNWSHIPEEIARGVYKRLGNLTLLAAKLNSNLGHGSFEEKRAAYELSSFLITRELATVPSPWGAQEVEERQAELATYASKAWPV